MSEKHANFIVNPGGRASAADIEAVIAHVRATVQQRTGIVLEPEVRVIGEQRMSGAEFGKVAVLMGGPSAEREISLMSGNARARGAARKGRRRARVRSRRARPVGAKREGFARVFIALHGRFGEDGTVQGALETLKVPYTGSGVMASALAMDKWRTKLVWHACGNSDAALSRWSTAKTDWMQVVAELGLPLIVKPAREGSTIGMTKVPASTTASSRRPTPPRRSTTTSCWSRSSSPARSSPRRSSAARRCR